MKEWDRFLAQLEKELGLEIVQEWMPRLIKFDAGNIYLEARDSFQLNWFEEHVRPKLKGLVNNNQRPIKVHLLDLKKKNGAPEEPLTFNPDPIDAEMSLGNYLPGEMNRVPHQLLLESGPFNPIFLFGPKGVGKTHLLMGAALHLQSQGKKVFFVRAETFTGHVVQAIRLGQMQKFRKVYRDIDALIIDDIQVFSKKTATQEEFFHTFNTLHTLGKTIIISSEVAPTHLNEIEPRLVSRFEWGISLALQRIDPKEIIKKKGGLWKMEIGEDLIEMLIAKFPNDPILPLQALAFRSKGGVITPVVAEKLLKDLLLKAEEQALSKEKIIKAVAAFYGVTGEDLLGKSQMKEFAFPRQVAMYLFRERLKWPFQKIGEFFGRDHSTVMGSAKQIGKNLEENKTPELRGFVDSIR
jgi:chromosomal replication initiator protein